MKRAGLGVARDTGPASQRQVSRPGGYVPDRPSSPRDPTGRPPAVASYGTRVTTMRDVGLSKRWRSNSDEAAKPDSTLAWVTTPW